MNKHILWLLDVLFPPHCAYCNKVLSHGSACPACETELPRIEPPVCLFCGFAAEDCSCKRKKRAYTHVAAPFYYKGRAAEGLRRFKFQEKPQLAAVFAAELARTFGLYYSYERVDLVCAVPMYPKKERARGYNQSALLAKETAKLLGLPFEKDLLVKAVDTPAQHGLDAHLRQGNILGAFDVAQGSALKGKTVLLIDDIKTTGATLHECAKMLLLNGAGKVLCLCAAVTPLAEKKPQGRLQKF